MRHAYGWLLASGVWFNVLSCGGVTSHDGAMSSTPVSAQESTPSSNDASTTDGAASAAGGGFCVGSSKVQHGGVMVDPASVTSSPLVMDCCSGFMFRLHTKSQLGTDLSVIVKSFEMFRSGDYAFGPEKGPLEVTVSGGDVPLWSGTAGTGSLHVQIPAGDDDPIRASLCLQVEAPGGSMHGTRLFLSDILIAPWSWQNRFEIRLLADTSLNAEQAKKLPLQSLSLASEPIVHLMLLQWYEWSTHTLTWDSWHNSQILLNYLPEVGSYGLPFVVLADGERVYLGALTGPNTVKLQDIPTISLPDVKPEGFRIEPASSHDPRDDPRISKALASSGKLAP